MPQRFDGKHTQLEQLQSSLWELDGNGASKTYCPELKLLSYFKLPSPTKTLPRCGKELDTDRLAS